jgi:Protein of unknown function (DUF3187)
VARALTLLLVLALTPPAWAQAATAPDESQPAPVHYGLLRMRDLTPFGFLRLDMRPASAVPAPPGTFGVEVDLGYQNTWAMSPNVEQYLKSLPGRRKLGPAEIQAIRNLPGEAYLVDLELGLLDVTLNYKLDQHWGVYGVFSAVHYGGGFLDGTIENFHKTFGMSSFGRPALNRNDVNVILDLKRTSLIEPDLPENGILDPTFGVRYNTAVDGEPWNVVIEGAVKVPYGGQRPFLSTGHTDLGVQLTLQRFWDRHAAYASVSGVHSEASEITPGYSRTFIPTLILGYEYRWTDKVNLVAQGYASRSVFNHDDTDLPDLLKTKYQASVGVRYRVGASVLTFAVTENLGSFNNTPDFGFQIGWTSSPPGR